MDQGDKSIAVEFETTMNAEQTPSPAFTQWVVRWLLFFLICTGLGYASVARYQPRTTAGLSDSALYYRLVAGEEVQIRAVLLYLFRQITVDGCHGLSLRSHGFGRDARHVGHEALELPLVGCVRVGLFRIDLLRVDGCNRYLSITKGNGIYGVPVAAT